MSEDLLRCVEVNPPEAATATVLWLHGLGADGHDFEPIVPHLGVDGLGIRFVFPHAPKRAVTINMGSIMPAWYDIRDVGLGRDVDDRGVQESCDAVRALIAHEESRGIPADRLVLAGFSQGGAIALHLGLRHAERLAGIVALSTYLLADTSDSLPAVNRATPVFLAHGLWDPVVPYVAGVTTRDRLRADGRDIRWQDYPMEHSVCLEEIEAVGAFLRERLPSP